MILQQNTKRRKQMKRIGMEDIDHLNFWTGYIGGSYPNSYDEEEDL